MPNTNGQVQLACADQASPVTFTIRQDILDLHQRTWKRIASAATWFDGQTRVAIASEVRQARKCTLCAERLDALSPFAVSGTHGSLGTLPEKIVEVVHRIVTDTGRLSKRWYQQVLDSGLTDAEYIEIVGLTCTVISVDTFTRGIGLPLQPLPEPIAGQPSRQRPAGAKIQLAWMATVEPEDIEEGELNPYREDNQFNVQKALSLVPQALIEFYDVDETYYLPQGDIRNFDANYRALSHSQMELIGTRGAQMNKCHYCSLSHAGVLLGSVEHEGKSTNLDGVLGKNKDDTGIEHGKLLLDFTEALLLGHDEQLDALRIEIYEAMGAEALVDVAATAASFNSIPRIPNATGIPLEEWKHEALFEMMEESGIGDFQSKDEAIY